jgi:ribonuclease Z
VSRHFDPTLINNPFDDPGLRGSRIREACAAYDLGDLGRLAPRKLLRVSDAFVTFTLTEAG